MSTLGSTELIIVLLGLILFLLPLWGLWKIVRRLQRSGQDARVTREMIEGRQPSHDEM